MWYIHTCTHLLRRLPSLSLPAELSYTCLFAIFFFFSFVCRLSLVVIIIAERASDLCRLRKMAIVSARSARVQVWSKMHIRSYLLGNACDAFSYTRSRIVCRRLYYYFIIISVTFIMVRHIRSTNQRTATLAHTHTHRTRGRARSTYELRIGGLVWP